MCGRFALHTPRSRIASRYFGLQLPVGDVHARYNITPGVQITTIHTTADAPAAFDFSHWGFRPPWAKEDAPTPINIRAEKAATSPYFRAAFAHRRCLIPANGWYEWRRTETGKQPYYITLKESEPDEVVFFAGLWEPAGEGSELGNLFNVTLGNPNDEDDGCSPNCLENTGPFSTFQSFWYWSGTVYAPSPSNAWLFRPNDGFQNLDFNIIGNLNGYVWPVRPGQDVGAPAPASIPVLPWWGLMLMGLGLAAVARRRLR